ncbi:MAG: hypothetical protein K6C32_01560 [Bacilli bacterium]|nr:hypothetical protein [Bacilli bacterium]
MPLLIFMGVSVALSVRTITNVLKVLENNKRIKRANGKRYGYWLVL